MTTDTSQRLTPRDGRAEFDPVYRSHGLLKTAPIEAGAASLTLSDRTPAAGDQLSLEVAKGPVTPRSEFGDPTTTTAYALCIYDESGGTPTLALSATAPTGGMCGPRPCWTMTVNGFRYANNAGTPDGLQKIVLNEGLGDGVASIKEKLFTGATEQRLPPSPALEPSRRVARREVRRDGHFSSGEGGIRTPTGRERRARRK